MINHSKRAKSIFISLPKGLSADTLTDKEVDVIFKEGVKRKQKKKT
jgi:hypothetical protein